MLALTSPKPEQDPLSAWRIEITILMINTHPNQVQAHMPCYGMLFRVWQADNFPQKFGRASHLELSHPMPILCPAS
jgi:hypothetical protein